MSSGLPMEGTWFAKGRRPSRDGDWRRPRPFRDRRRSSHLSVERGGDKGYSVDMDVGEGFQWKASSHLGRPVDAVSAVSLGGLRAFGGRKLAVVSASRAVLQKLAGSVRRGKLGPLVTVRGEAG